MSVVVRVPEGLYENVRKIAAVQGRAPADLLNEAWEHYLDVHREEVATAFQEYADQLLAADGDTEPTRIAAQPIPAKVVKRASRRSRPKVVS